MRNTLPVCLLGAVLAAIAAMGGCSTSGASSSSVLVEAACDSGSVRPTQIVLACGDGNAIAKNLTWSKWTNQFAEGRGAVSQNDCAPDCAQGHFVDYVADFRLSELVVAGAHRFFTRITITYNGQGPTGQRVEVLKDCWDNPPNPGVPRCPADLQGGQH